MNNEITESEFIDAERRSSIRVRVLLPCSVRLIDVQDIPALESRILDQAVMDSEYADLEMMDWSERTDEISREMVYMLNEVRALRQQLLDMQRTVETQGTSYLQRRWMVLNDRGVWLTRIDSDPVWEKGQFAEVKLQIPSLASPHILAMAEVVRSREEGHKPGTAFSFRSISAIHARAILRYTLRRERELARSKLFSRLQNL